MKNIPSHRRWRGANDTLADFVLWLKTWGNMLAFLLRSPRRTILGLKKYKLAEAFLSVPGIVDSYTGNASGARLREKQEEISKCLQSCFACAAAVFRPSEKNVYTEGQCAEIILRGFPGLKTVSVPTALLLFGEEKALPDIGVCSILCSARSEKQTPPPVFVLKSEDGAVIDCIRFVEKHSGERFDWDAFTEYLSTLTGEKKKTPAEAVELLARRYL